MKTPKYIEEFRKDFERFITEFYFVHCKPEKRPDFKRLDEAQVWYDQQNFKSNTIIANQIDKFSIMLTKTIEEEKKKVVEDIIEFVEKQYPWKKPRPNQVVNYRMLMDFLKLLSKLK